MITLSASGGSVTFEFSGNSTYLNDGTITVPVNSLALIIDESDMATFRKAASNDIFVSANIAEFGMTKDELESWYKANMVGSTGGGGGVTSGEVQTMIDEATSGKTNQSDFTAYTASTDAALSGKVDTEDLEISGKTIYGVASSIIQDDVSNKQYKSFILRLNRKNSINQRMLVSFDVYSNGSSVSTVRLYAAVSETDGFTNAYLDNTTYANVAIVDDGMGLLVTFADGYYLGTYTRTPSYTTYFQMEFPSIIVTSGSTPAVVEQGVYDALETISDTILVDEKNIATISANTLNALTAASINYVDNNIRLSKANLSGATSNSDLAVDNSLSYHDGKLGVYTTGATHTISLNGNYRGASNYAVSNYSGVVKMYINQSYTGTTPTTRALYFDTNSEYGTYTYDGGTDEFTPDGTYTTVSFAYDKTNHLVTFTTVNDAVFYTVGSSGYIAPATALTQENCFIGLVTIDTNSYKLQEALDNKQDTLTAGSGISISGNVISATGGGSSNLPISAGTGVNSVIVNSTSNTASGNYSYAEGNSTTASGHTSHAEGSLTKANGYYSHAEGTSTQANGSNSHAEGKYSKASGQTSHAEGDNTRANGIKSHAEGSSTVANGSNSHVEGSNTIANNESEHASGEYNVSNTGESTSAQTLFSVGNGGWDETAQDVVRHNAFEIRKNGDIYFFDGANDVKLQDAIPTTTSAVTSGSTDVVTSGGVYAKMGGMTIVKITESDYQSLSVKDPDTLYVVIPDPTNP